MNEPQGLLYKKLLGELAQEPKPLSSATLGNVSNRFRLTKDELRQIVKKELNPLR